MTLEKKPNELDEFFVSSEELRLFDQLISADLDLANNEHNCSVDREEYYEGESLTEPSDCNAEVESSLFPEVGESFKENLASSTPISELKKRKGSLGNLGLPVSASWNVTKKKTRVLQSVQVTNTPKSDSETEDGSDTSTSSFLPWICRICKKQFKQQYALNRHLPVHTQERKFACDICGKAFRQESTLIQHRAIHSDKRPFICPVCEKSFNRVSTLISHKKIHAEEKPHKCTFCGKAFHQKGNLRNHIFTHTNERPYKCKLCDKGFNQMSNLAYHRVNNHAKEMPYQCKRCMQIFEARSSLLYHEEVAHGIRFPAKVLSKYTCANMDPTSSELHGMDDIKLTIDAFESARLQEIISQRHIPFALLETNNGKCFPVKLASAPENKLFILPTTDHEMAQHSQCGPNNVLIKLPIVAKIVQSYDETGRFQLNVEPITGEENNDNSTDSVTQENEEEAALSLLSLN